MSVERQVVVTQEIFAGEQVTGGAWWGGVGGRAVSLRPEETFHLDTRCIDD